MERSVRISRLLEELKVPPQKLRGMIVDVSEERLRIMAKARIDHAECLHIRAAPTNHLHQQPSSADVIAVDVSERPVACANCGHVVEPDIPTRWPVS